MGPRDRHSILRFIAFCQNNILCAAIFSESELGADVAPEQFHVGEGRQDVQNKDGCFRRDGWPGKKSRGPVPCPLQWHMLLLPCPCGSAFVGFKFKGRHRTEAGWGASPPGASLQPGKDGGCLAGPPWVWPTLREGRSLPRGSGLCLHPVCPCKAPRFSQKHGVPQLPLPQGGRVPAAQSEGPGQAQGRI